MSFEPILTYFWLLCGFFWAAIGISVYVRGRKLVADGITTELELRRFATGLVVSIGVVSVGMQVLQLLGGHESGFYIYCARSDLISILTWILGISANFALSAWILMGTGEEALLKFGPLLNLPSNPMMIKGFAILLPLFSIGMSVSVIFFGYGDYACDAA